MSSGVEFDTQPYGEREKPRSSGSAKISAFTSFLISKGIVRDNKQADYLYIAIILVCVAAIWFSWGRASNSASSDPNSKPYDPIEETRKAREKYGIVQ